MPRMMAVDVEFADTGFLQSLKIARRVILSKWIILKLNRYTSDKLQNAAVFSR
ncbi:hypothetical protein ACN9OX_11600 [Glaesserella parasuis]|uniref:hypothetical protein n=1 Tax=Glaesserella parasuis TaxID=738 RepID=UPI003B685FB3